MATKIIPISDLRRKASEVIKEVQNADDAIYITQHGRPAAVLVNYNRYEALLAQLEDLSDLVSLQSAVAEPDRPYEAFLDELGLAPDESSKNSSNTP